MPSVLVAQDRAMGVQVRVSQPADTLRDVTGGRPALGVGLSLAQPMGDAWDYRVALGADLVPEGTSTRSAAQRGKATLARASFEVLWFPEPDLGPERLGPFATFGIAFVAWDIRRTDADLQVATARRVAHAAGVAGFGYRVSPVLDLELGLLYGRVDPDLSAGLITVGVTYRF